MLNTIYYTSLRTTVLGFLTLFILVVFTSSVFNNYSSIQYPSILQQLFIKCLLPAKLV